MTIKKSIKELRTRGYRVSYRQRKDGGILIKSINGQKYRGASGNSVARAILGQKLSEARQVQLRRLNPYKIEYEKKPKTIKGVVQVYKSGKKKGMARTITKRVKTIFDKERTRPALEKKAKLPDALVMELKSVQNLWRKGSGKVSAHTSIKGTITLGNLRYAYETYGEQEAWEKLAKAKRYALGYAYEENVRWLRETIKQDIIDKATLYGFDASSFIDIYEKLGTDEVIENFQEEWINAIHDIYYDFTKRGMAFDQYNIDEAARKINEILKG